MIPLDYITEWRQCAPWSLDVQVEQDLIISRALVELFNQPTIARALAFRGGTALYKLFMTPALRYSEDLDFVQTAPEPIGATIDAVRSVLDPWLGEPRRAFGEGRVTLQYRMQSEGPPALPMRLKIEINSREHFTVFGAVEKSFEVQSRWFHGTATIQTYSLNELLGTKLRALYQRRKGRDLFDLARALERSDVEPAEIVVAFARYLKHGGIAISRAEFEANLSAKLEDPRFLGDIVPLLVSDAEWNPEVAGEAVKTRLLPLLPGEPWKGDATAKAEKRRGKRR